MVLTMPPLVLPSQFNCGGLAGVAAFEVHRTELSWVLGVSVMVPALKVTVVADPLVNQHVAQTVDGITPKPTSNRPASSRLSRPGR
ncbi:hypothetical protein UU5_18497 [Rhodanobacter sp. 115]|nr:hypothetical protein UU5_18497 [Rhodanobacter sp. 115]